MVCTGAQVTRVTSQITITNKARLTRTTFETTLKNIRNYTEKLTGVQFIDDQVSYNELPVIFLGSKSGA